MTEDSDKGAFEKELLELIDDIDSRNLWKSKALYPNPEWYPSGSEEVNAAWEYFAYMGKGGSAMEAIEAILKEGLSLPNDLISSVLEACRAWRKGNKGELRKMKNQQKVWDDYHAIYILRMKGDTKEDATRKVAEKGNGRSFETLMDTHKYPIYKEVRDSFHERLLAVYFLLESQGRDEECHFLEENYPNFFKTRTRIEAFQSIKHLLE